MQNRVFRSPEPATLRDFNWVDVSETAYEARFPFQTFVSKALIQNYTISGIPDDDEGRLFVHGLVDDILAAITGNRSVSCVSHGKSFTVVFEFLAQHRRRPAPEFLTLQAFFGPWDGEPQVHVSMMPQTSRSSANSPMSLLF